MTDTITFAFQCGLGPWLTPLHGKVPVFDRWNTLDPVDENTVRAWVEQGYNLGLRTGAGSRVIVIDDDRARNGLEPYDAPPTDLIAQSPTGGLHFYYVAPSPCPGNSASKLAPYVDVRGEGGQVVYPGSSHPTTRTPYRWVKTGKPGTLPAGLIDPPAKTVRVDTSRPAVNGTGYTGSALHREIHAVRTATEGTRNDTLNRAAYSLAGLIHTGEITEAQIRDELTAAALIAGLSEREILGTLASGIRKGLDAPRQIPERASTTSTAVRPRTPNQTRPDVLVPGAHNLPPNGEYREQGSDVYAEQVLTSLDPGTVYRRAGSIGTIEPVDGFAPVGADLFRSVIDRSVRLCFGRESKDDPGSYTLGYRPCSGDLSRVVLSYAERHGSVRDLQFLAAHPVCTGAQFDIAEPGWNESSGVYLQIDNVPDPLPLDEAKAVLEDLVCDFPFQNDSDRANYFGLMLTPILRPALREPVPLHLITSPIERTGKTKLAEIVLGCSVLGHPTPALQIGVREEEREKRITSLLLSGASVAHLDNLSEFVDSPALASLLTSTTYQGRELGQSRIVTIPNGLTLVASGNNLHATGEIAKRVVPIRLLPPTESPETRQDYRHPLLRAYVERSRPRVLGALLGLVRAWKDAGSPLGGVGFGGFERWAAVLGGIMRVAGYRTWLSNMATWRGVASDFGSDLRAFVETWVERHGEGWVAAADLFALAEELELFPAQLAAPTDRGRRTAFGMSVLNAAEGRVVSGVRIEVAGSGKRRRARACAQPQA